MVGEGQDAEKDNYVSKMDCLLYIFVSVKPCDYSIQSFTSLIQKAYPSRNA